MSEKEALLLIGLANKARRIVSGTELVIKTIQKGQAFLVIIATDVSSNTKKRVINKCDFYSVPYKIIFEREQIGHNIGKDSRALIAITDQGFSKQLLKLLD